MIKLFKKHENVWMKVENFRTEKGLFGVRIVGSREVEELAWGSAGFEARVIDWLSRYKVEFSTEHQALFLNRLTSAFFTFPKSRRFVHILIPFYGNVDEFDVDLRSNFASAICHLAEKENFEEIYELVADDYEKNDADVFLSKYFGRYSWTKAEEDVVESIVKNSLLYSRYRHETSLVAAKLGMIEVIPLIESARAAGDSSDQFKDEKYARALFSLRKQRYLADMKDLSDDSASIDRALLDLEHAEVAPFAAFFLGKVKASNARTALEAAVGSKNVALRREAKTALKKIGP